MVNGEKLLQEVYGQGSHASQSSLVAHFGLADNTTISQLKVIWSSTDTQIFTDLVVNKRYELTQGSTLRSEENEFMDLSMYPNPVKSEFNVLYLIDALEYSSYNTEIIFGFTMTSL